MKAKSIERIAEELGVNFYDLYPLISARDEYMKQAGIKEVVEWGLETCPHDLFGEGTQCFKRACDMCWQQKWGTKV